MHVQTINSFKLGKAQIGIGCFAILLALPFLLYYGYCWGLWGRNSLFLQYFFQCRCPFASEEWRYARQVDVIVSACQNPISSRLSPSGRFLYVSQEDAGLISRILLDLETKERVDAIEQPFSSFLTDDLWFLQEGLDYYIIDRITGVQYPVEKFVFSRPNAQLDRAVNQPLVLESLRQSEQIFLVGPSTDTVVALAADFRTHPERIVLFDRFDLPDSNTQQFLQEHHIAFELILPDYPHEVVSPNGKLIARDDGIYLIETNQRIVKAPPSLVNGWISNGEGAIYSSYGLCLIHTFLPFADDTGCEIRVRQPVLLLRVPAKYLSPQEVQ
jgi:hypothetical protein